MERHSPLQNRVTPFGEVIATPERGAFMGNRGGCFHDDQHRLRVSRWVNTHWIACLLEFKGWHREVMQPRRYTELFFLDEATAYAAGHRPCFECRRADGRRFQQAWLAANPGLADPAGGIGAVDVVLHRERTSRDRRKVTFDAPLATLPDGTMFAAGADHAFLRWRGRDLPWSPGGYGAAADLQHIAVQVLTPASVVRMFRQGVGPSVHPSAR